LQSDTATTWGGLTGADFGGSVVGDLVHSTGVFSVVESLMWQSILRDACDTVVAGAGNQAAPLVIDGGAHIGPRVFRHCIVCAFHLNLKSPLPSPLPPGYFSLLSLALGCRVVAFEPQQRLLPIIARSLHFNSFNPEDFTLVPCALSAAAPEPASSECLMASDHPNWGEWSLVAFQV